MLTAEYPIWQFPRLLARFSRRASKMPSHIPGIDLPDFDTCAEAGKISPLAQEARNTIRRHVSDLRQYFADNEWQGWLIAITNAEKLLYHTYLKHGEMR